MLSNRRIHKTDYKTGFVIGLLLFVPVLATAQAPPMPKLAVLPVRTNYFVLTATNAGLGLESLPAPEISFTGATVRLRWDYEDMASWPGTTFNLYWGKASGRATNRIQLGSGTNVVWPIIRTVTNILTLSAPSFSWSMTNPAGQRFFRMVLQQSDSPAGPWADCVGAPLTIGIKAQ